MQRLVMIEWQDAYGSGGMWQAVDEVEAASVDCITVGMVQDENDETICVMQTLGVDTRGEDGVYNFFCVPKRMILHISELEIS